MTIQLQIESQIISIVLGGPQLPPVDLVRISRNIGVADIRPTSFRNGFTDFSSAAPIIYLNRLEPSARIRYIFAHELAHVMLQMPEVIQLLHTRGRADLLADEEKLADSVARTLLVPDDWVEDVRGTRLRLGSLGNIAKRAGVPLPMLITRMASSGIDVGLLCWRRGNDAWHVIDRPGVPVGLHGYVRPSAIGYKAIENLGDHESNVVIDCHINGKHAKISGMCRRRNSHMLQLIEPSRDIWVCTAEESSRTPIGSAIG